MPEKFVKVKELLNSHVCKDVPPVYIRRKVKQVKIPDSAKKKHQKIVLIIPDEYAFALMEMYENAGLQKAIMKHIKFTVVPMKDE